MERYLGSLSAGVLFRATPGERRGAAYQWQRHRKIASAFARRLDGGIRVHCRRTRNCSDWGSPGGWLNSSVAADRRRVAELRPRILTRRQEHLLYFDTSAPGDLSRSRSPAAHLN